MTIHDMLTLTRPLIVFDVETTGLDCEKDRIVELGFQQFLPDGKVVEWRSLVNPGVPIPSDVTKVHGITNERMLACRECGGIRADSNGNFCTCPDFKPVPTFKQLAPRLATGFSNCDFGGKNIRFDLRFMAAEMKRAGQRWSYATAKIIDADRLEQIGEPRTLSHLYTKHVTEVCNTCDGEGVVTAYAGVQHDRCGDCNGSGRIGKKLIDAHQAMADVKATSEVITAQLRKYNVLPHDLDQLHALQWPGWVDTEGKIRRDSEGVARLAFGKHSGVDVRQVPTGYWKWITDADFSDEFKELAGRILKGETL